MKTFFDKYLPALLSVLFTAAVFWFWAFPYKSVLSFQEQYQLFLFTPGYFWQRLAVPGGMADYLGEFLTQFDYHAHEGAFVIAITFLALQRLLWVLCRRCGAARWWYPLSFLPPLLLWAYMGDENVLFSLVVALLAATLTCLHYIIADEHYKTRWGRMVYGLLGLPLFYWLFGAAVWLVAVFMSLYELSRRRWVFAVAVPCYAFAAVLLLQPLTDYPLARALVGINYYRYYVPFPLMQFVVMAVFAVTPVVLGALRDRGAKVKMLEGLQVVLLAVAGFVLIRGSFDKQKYEIICYDYLVRTHQWDAIIHKAEASATHLPLPVSAVNLALSAKGQLLDRLFQFYQNGSQGLLPNFQRDMTTPLCTGEAFFMLGMTNDAERFAYEAQEAIPNYRKSGRVMKRLAECNLVNEHYAVARKYLTLLTHSLYYKRWAERQLALLDNHQVDAEYLTLRALHIKHHEFLFSETEMDQMLGILFIDNKQKLNRMAYEYLIAYELLDRDMEKFVKYYSLGQHIDYDHIPYAVQQVLVGNWMRTHNSLHGMPYSVDQQNVASTVNFIQIYMQNPNDPRLQLPPYSYNAWSYLMARQNKQ